MKFKFKNTLLVSFLAIAGILGVSSALINKQVNQSSRIEKADAYSGTQNEDATKIYWKDEIGWSYKTIKFDIDNYYTIEDYTYQDSDFEHFLTTAGFTKKTTWGSGGFEKQGTTKMWIKDGNGYFYVCLGGSGGANAEYEIVLPWWVGTFSYMFCNNDHETGHADSGSGDGKWIVTTKDGWGCHYEMKCYIYGSYPNQNVSVGSAESGYKYDFNAWQITLKFRDAGGNEIADDTTALVSIFNKYVLTSSDIKITGYDFAGVYKNAALSTAYTPSYYTGTGNLFVKYTIHDYIITLNTNGGTINSGNVTSYNYGVGAVLPSDVTKPNKAFGGWFDNSGCTGTPVTNIGTTDTGNKTYWASWIDEGMYGGETYFLVDKYGFFTSDHIRIYLWDENGHSYFAGPFTTKTDWKIDGKDVYYVTIPEYDGTHSCGWSHFIILQYKTTGDSDTGIVDANRVRQTADLSCNWWADKNTWTAKDVSTDGWNHINMEGSNSDDRSGFASGSIGYLDPNNHVITAGNHYAIRFYGAVGYGTEVYSAVMIFDASNDDYRQVYGTDFQLGTSTEFFANGLWEFRVPYATGDKFVIWNRYDLVELASGSTAWSTTNIVAGSGDLNNQITYNNNVIKYYTDGDYVLAPSLRLEAYVRYFNNVTQSSTGVCRADGSTDRSALQTAWASCKKQFPLDANAGEYFTNASPVGSGAINNAVSRYDYIVYKYGSDTTNFPDYAGRVAAGTSLYSANRSFIPFSLFGAETNFSTIIIVIASSVALLSVTALSILIIRKRKNKVENN